MKHFALAILVVAAACSGKSKTDTTEGGSATLAKKIVVSWGIQQETSAAELFLQTTDETGKQVSHALGKFDGKCATAKPADEMKALIGVRCMAGSTGTELHAIWNSGEIIVLKMRVDEGVAPDPMAREEITRIDVPNGSAVEAGV